MLLLRFQCEAAASRMAQWRIPGQPGFFGTGPVKPGWGKIHRWRVCRHKASIRFPEGAKIFQVSFYGNSRVCIRLSVFDASQGSGRASRETTYQQKSAYISERKAVHRQSTVNTGYS